MHRICQPGPECGVADDGGQAVDQKLHADADHQEPISRAIATMPVAPSTCCKRSAARSTSQLSERHEDDAGQHAEQNRRACRCPAGRSPATTGS